MTLAKVILFFGLVSTLTACSHPLNREQVVTETPPDTSLSYRPVKNSLFSEVALAKTNADKDRAAILAMQGEYKVSFDFKETVVLAEDYERFAPKHSGAFEVVIVVEDAPTHIALQHILMVGDTHVVKHWRQDWFLNATERFEFVEEQTWRLKTIPTDKRNGQWTQCVYEVSDAPRYCGTGKWNHRYGVSTWTSDRSWRPLPRREYTTRNDYNALNVENRHTVTPSGWTHEQDNTKAKRQGKKTEQTLVREFGFNDYRRISGFDFTPAYHYWEKTAAYWSIIRDIWSSALEEKDEIVLNTAVDGMPVIEATFAYAEAIENGETIPERSVIEQTLRQWINNTMSTVMSKK